MESGVEPLVRFAKRLKPYLDGTSSQVQHTDPTQACSKASTTASRSSNKWPTDSETTNTSSSKSNTLFPEFRDEPFFLEHIGSPLSYPIIDTRPWQGTGAQAMARSWHRDHQDSLYRHRRDRRPRTMKRRHSTAHPDITTVIRQCRHKKARRPCEGAAPVSIPLAQAIRTSCASGPAYPSATCRSRTNTEPDTTVQSRSHQKQPGSDYQDQS